MSGMAGNVTAFNTVFTYDLYQGYIKKDGSDAHYLAVGRWTTVVGILASMAAAYAAASFNNIMDILQLVFAFVERASVRHLPAGHVLEAHHRPRRVLRLIAGTVAAAIHHGLSLPHGASAGIKGGWLGAVHVYPSEMAQNFWTAIFAWSTCFIATILISLLTRQKKPTRSWAGWSIPSPPRSRNAMPAGAAPGPARQHRAGARRCSQPPILVTAMHLDVRIPIGLLFVVFGAILAIFACSPTRRSTKATPLV